MKMLFQWFMFLMIYSLIRIESSNSIIDSSNRRTITSFHIQNTNDTYYENNIFGLPINKPDGWYSMSSEEMRWLYEDSILNRLPYFNSSVDSLMKGIKQKLMPVFAFMEYPVNTTIRFNSQMVGWIMNNTGNNRIDNDCKALFEWRNDLFISKYDSVISIDCHEVIINGKTFSMQELINSVPNLLKYRETQYATNTKNDYFFIFQLMYNNITVKNKLDNAIHSLKFFKQ
ncbi:hypothetical protein I4U23_027582 [Adineta vaga]|nr:hypothetical protein I4U23_027582 [Adineta vaga]